MTASDTADRPEHEATEAWRQFLAAHVEWLRRRAAESADAIVYGLPCHVVDRLSDMVGDNPDALKAEQSFAELCRRMQAIGVDAPAAMGPDVPAFVRYRWLTPVLRAPANVPADMLLRLGWMTRDVEQVDQSCSTANRVDERIKGVAGRLICWPAYLADRYQLRECWLTLPDEERPSFPLERTARVTHLPHEFGATPASDQCQQFARDFNGFCDRWCLQGLATWDLPNPSGPIGPTSIWDRGR